MQECSVSLVIPVYNRPKMIAECLASLVPSLDCLCEVIVVDDGSTDGKTRDAVRQAISALGAEDKVRLIEQKNAGPGSARNTGVSVAKGNWIAFLDSDDLWLPWSGRALKSCVEKYGDAQVILFEARYFKDAATISEWSEAEAEIKVHPDIFDLILKKPRVVRVGAGYFSIRRDLFNSIGGFVPDLHGSEDTDLFYRLGGRGDAIALEAPTMVALRVDSADALTRNMSALSAGLYFLLDGRKEGRYDDAPHDGIEQSLAEIFAYWLHALFWGGWGREAYDLLLRRGAFGIMVRNGYSKAAFKLLFIPILSILRPKNHRFRWRPKAKV